MQEVLPRASTIADNHPKKAKRLVRNMVQAILAGTEVMWRALCNLAARSGNVKVAVSRKMRFQAKVAAIMQQIKRAHIACLSEATVSQITSGSDTHVQMRICYGR